MIHSSSDMKRIVELQAIQRPNQAWAEHYSSTIVLPNAPLNPNGTPFRLKLEQAWALFAYRAIGGIIAPISVGGGKTLVSLMLAQAGIWERGHNKVLLLIPNDAIIQLTEKDLPWAKQRIRMDFNWHLVAGKTPAVRQRIAASNDPGLYIMAYSQLSTVDAVDLLRAISPTLIIGDEAHRLSNPRAARTKRFFDILGTLQKEIASQGKRVEYCFMSGTMARKKVSDMARLMRAALRENAPVPMMDHVVKEWDAQLSAENVTFYVDSSMTPLIQWANAYFPADRDKLQFNVVGARHAYSLRMRHAPGVITSAEGSTASSLLIEDTKSAIEPTNPAEWAKLEEYLGQLEKFGMKPNGDLVPTPMHMFKERFELTAGIYNDQYWPSVEDVQRVRGIGKDQALELVDRSKAWLQEEQLLFGLMFQFTKHSRVGLDSPRDIGNAIARGHTHELPKELVAQYYKVKGMDFEGRLERRKRAVRVCDFKLKKVVEAVCHREKGEGALVWAHNTGVRLWLVELLKAAGQDAVDGKPGCDDTKRMLLDPRNREKVFVCSLKAHSEILNLQHFGLNYYAQWPRQANTVEQSLGRTHRAAQERDEIVAYTFLQTQIDHEIMGACLVDATFAHQILGAPQKAVIARYNPPPQLPPLEMLYERVPDIERLPPEAAKEYLRKFGGRS